MKPRGVASTPLHRSAAPLTAVPDELSDKLGVLLPVEEAVAVSLGVGGLLGVPVGLREREGLALGLAVPLADSLALCNREDKGGGRATRVTEARSMRASAETVRGAMETDTRRIASETPETTRVGQCARSACSGVPALQRTRL